MKTDKAGKAGERVITLNITDVAMDEPRGLSKTELEILRALTVTSSGKGTIEFLASVTGAPYAGFVQAISHLDGLEYIRATRKAGCTVTYYKITASGLNIYHAAVLNPAPIGTPPSIAGHPLPWSIVPEIRPPAKRPEMLEEDHEEEAPAAFIVDADGFQVRRIYVDGAEGKLWKAVVEHLGKVTTISGMLADARYMTIDGDGQARLWKTPSEYLKGHHEGAEQ